MPGRLRITVAMRATMAAARVSPGSAVCWALAVSASAAALHLAVLQSGSDLPGPGCGGWHLVADQQDDRTLLAQVQHALQRWEELQQLSPLPVGLTGPVVDQIEAARGQGAQVNGYLVAGPQGTKGLAHACLVGDDERVLWKAMRAKRPLTSSVSCCRSAAEDSGRRRMRYGISRYASTAVKASANVLARRSRASGGQ